MHQEEQPPVSPIDALESAKAAGLRYVSDAQPGIQRKRAGRNFSYIDSHGHAIRDHTVLRRIKRLGIPPAWNDVWISPDPRGHIQATGRDAKGRKQYRYHERWRAIRDETKYSRMVMFGETLPMIRKWVSKDLSATNLSRERVLATVVALLDATHIRIGNQEYAKENDSFGLTTMRTKHVDVHGSTIRFSFRGKAGKEHRVSVHDPRLARVVRRCQELSGHELFQYLDDSGQSHTIASDDVNEYLQHITGQYFTAKDFRTWRGTLVAAHFLKKSGPACSMTEGKRNVALAVATAAQELGNTPAICRKSYVHPGVIDAYLDGALLPSLELQNERTQAESRDDLSSEEAEVLALLRGLMGQHDKQGAA